MKKDVLDYVVKKTEEMMGASSCSKEAKEAGQAWLDSLGTDQEDGATKKYVEELESHIMPVDMLIGFAESDGGTQVFGADVAKEVAAHGKENKAAGSKYWDCPACAAVEAILEKKEDLLQ